VVISLYYTFSFLIIIRSFLDDNNCVIVSIQQFIYLFYPCNIYFLRIGEVIDEDVLHTRVPFVARTQQCFAVKAGADGLLDMARRSFCDTSEGFSTILHDLIYLFLELSGNFGAL